MGFEQAGYSVSLAYDIHQASVDSYNHNRAPRQRAHVEDIRELTLEKMDRAYGKKFMPIGVIGGPPCQSFSKSNIHKISDDPRSELLLEYLRLIEKLHYRSPLSFVVLENVPEIGTFENGHHFDRVRRKLRNLGFKTRAKVFNARNFSVPQNRQRMFLIASSNHPDSWAPWKTVIEKYSDDNQTVLDAIGDLPEPILFERGLDMADSPIHPNHWCMQPKSKKFTDGSIEVGNHKSRSFRTLDWNEPSFTVAYGNREVHVHPGGRRRLSVYEAMLLQGYPKDYVLKGTMSDQFQQVSQAVPPPMAHAIAAAMKLKT